MLPEIKESQRDFEYQPQPLHDLMKVNRKENDYLP